MSATNQVFKGITVEFNGDTSNLDTAISQLNKELKDLKSSLSDVNSKLKRDPLNSDLINQKLTILNDTIAVAENRVKKWGDGLSALKSELKNTEKAQDSLTESAGGYDKLNEEQLKKYQELQVKIEQYNNAINSATKSYQNAEKDLKRYLNQLDKFKANHYSDYFKKLADSANKVKDTFGALKSITAPISLVSGGALTAAAKEASDFETALISVNKVLKDVGTGTRNTKGITEVENDIKKMAQTIPVSIDTIAESFANAAQLGIQNDDLSKFVETLLRLDSATDISASDAATQLAQFYNIIGKDTSTIDKLANSIVRLGNNTATTESAIVEMASNLGASASQVNFTEDQIVALSAALSSMGLDGSGAGTAISTSLTQIDKAISLGKAQEFANVLGVTEETLANMWKADASETFVKLIGSLKQASDDGQNLNVILKDLNWTSIRQDRTIKALVNNYDGLTKAMEMSRDAFQNGNDAVDESNKAWESFKSSVQLLINNFQLLGKEIGDRVLTKITPFIDKLSALAEQLTNSSDGAKDFITNLLLVGAVLSPLFGTVSNIAKNIGGVFTTISKLIKGEGFFNFIQKMQQLGLSGGLKLGVKIGLIAIAVIALIAAFKKAWDTSDTFRASIRQVWESLKSIIATLKELWDTTLGPLLTDLKDLLQPILDKVLTALANMWEIIVQVFAILVALIDWCLKVLVPFFSGVWNNILKPLIKDLTKFLIDSLNLITTVIGGIINIVNKGINKLMEFLGLGKKAEDVKVPSTSNVKTKIVATTADGIGLPKNNNIGYGINSGGLGLAGNANNNSLYLSNSIIVNNNGEPINQSIIRSWADEITDIVSENLGRRICNV